MNDVAGINEAELNNLILEINDYEDEISNIFNQIEDTFTVVKQAFNCEAGVNFDYKFSSLKSNFSIVKKNLSIYTDDLIRAKNNQIQVDSVAKKVVAESISNIENITGNNI